MFTKLLKHEWKASCGILGILSLAALGVGVLGAIILRVITSLNVSSVAEELLVTLLASMLLFLILALVAYVVGTEIVLMYRFYKSKFTDQGYLTFTLPVSSRQIFLASFLNICVWMMIASLVATISGLLILVLGINWKELVDPWIMEEMKYMFGGSTQSPENAGYLLLSFLAGVIAFVAGIVTPMTCITLGAVLAKKHKLLVAFGIYYGQSMISSIAESIFSVMAMLSMASYAVMISPVLTIIFQLGWAIGGFFLSTYLMERKLNLP